MYTLPHYALSMPSIPTFQQITHTGQITIPVGVHAFGVNVISGQAVVNGVVYPAGESIAWTAADSRLILGGAISVGATGLGNRTAVYWTT